MVLLFVNRLELCLGIIADNQDEIPLTGICKIEPQRQVSIIGHNSLRIDVLKPPRGVGISLEIDSHYLRKRDVCAPPARTKTNPTIPL